MRPAPLRTQGRQTRFDRAWLSSGSLFIGTPRPFPSDICFRPANRGLNHRSWILPHYMIRKSCRRYGSDRAQDSTIAAAPKGPSTPGIARARQSRIKLAANHLLDQSANLPADHVSIGSNHANAFGALHGALAGAEDKVVQTNLASLEHDLFLSHAKGTSSSTPKAV
jgi:hypothetical protein